MQETPGSEPPEIRVWTGYEASCSQTPGQSPPSFPEVKVKSLSRVQLCDPCTVAHQAPPSMGFSRQEYWSGLPFPSFSLADGKSYDSQESLVPCSGSTEVRCLQNSDVNPGSDVKKVLWECHFPFQAQESLPTFLLMVSWGTGWDAAAVGLVCLPGVSAS